MAQEKVYLELPPFTGRNVPIIEIAKAMHKDAQYAAGGGLKSTEPGRRR